MEPNDIPMSHWKRLASHIFKPKYSDWRLIKNMPAHVFYWDSTVQDYVFFPDITRTSHDIELKELDCLVAGAVVSNGKLFQCAESNGITVSDHLWLFSIRRPNWVMAI